MSSASDKLVQDIFDHCDDDMGDRILEAIRALGPRNNATMTMVCAQILANQLSQLKSEVRLYFWDALERVVVLCMNTQIGED